MSWWDATVDWFNRNFDGSKVTPEQAQNQAAAHGVVLPSVQENPSLYSGFNIASPTLGNAPNTSINSGLNSIASSVSSAAGGALSMLNPISAGIQAGTGLVGMLDDIFDWSGKRKQQREQFNKQVELQEKQWEREDNAVQRRAEDLEKAGLSKTLAAGSAAQASSPMPVSVPNPVEGISGGVTSALRGIGDSLQGYMVRKELENKDKADRMALQSMKNSLRMQKNELELSDLEVDNARFARANREYEYIKNQVLDYINAGMGVYSGVSNVRMAKELLPYRRDWYAIHSADTAAKHWKSDIVNFDEFRDFFERHNRR